MTKQHTYHIQKSAIISLLLRYFMLVLVALATCTAHLNLQHDLSEKTALTELSFEKDLSEDVSKTNLNLPPFEVYIQAKLGAKSALKHSAFYALQLATLYHPGIEIPPPEITAA